MTNRTKVFVSSTLDLAEERAALKQEVPEDLFKLFLFEDYVDQFDFTQKRSKSPEEVCRDEIMSSPIFLGLLGKTYGSVFPPKTGTISLSRWEFNKARDLSEERGINIQIFRKDIPETEVDKQQLEFINEITRFDVKWSKKFRDKDRLVKDVLRALMVWKVAYHQALTNENVKTASWLQLHLAPVALTSMVLLVIVFAILVSRVPGLWLGLACAPFAVVPILCLVLLWSQLGGRNAG